MAVLQQPQRQQRSGGARGGMHGAAPVHSRRETGRAHTHTLTHSRTHAHTDRQTHAVARRCCDAMQSAAAGGEAPGPPAAYNAGPNGGQERGQTAESRAIGAPEGVAAAGTARPDPKHLSWRLSDDDNDDEGDERASAPGVPVPAGTTAAEAEAADEGDDEPHEKVRAKSPDGRYLCYDEILGSGAFKTVYKAFDTEEAIEVAWNELKTGTLSRVERQRFVAEVELLKKLRHPNIITVYASWIKSPKGPGRGRGELVFVTELMTSGTLKQFIQRAKGKIKLKVIRSWCRQILAGLSYLHERKIIHRDIKCDNIFINGSDGSLKIGDMGLAKSIESQAQSVIGTPEFMAPEMYTESYTEKVDVYAFGMCVLEISTGEYPYSECSNAAQVYRRVMEGRKPEALERVRDSRARSFIGACLEPEGSRPSCRELLQHPLIVEEEDEQDEEMEVQASPQQVQRAASVPSEPGANATEAAGAAVLHASGVARTPPVASEKGPPSPKGPESTRSTESLETGRSAADDSARASLTAVVAPGSRVVRVSSDTASVAPEPAARANTAAAAEAVPSGESTRAAAADSHSTGEPTAPPAYILMRADLDKVQLVERNGDNVRMRVCFRVPQLDKKKQCMFDYNVCSDSPSRIAREMVRGARRCARSCMRQCRDGAYDVHERRSKASAVRTLPRPISRKSQVKSAKLSLRLSRRIARDQPRRPARRRRRLHHHQQQYQNRVHRCRRYSHSRRCRHHHHYHRMRCQLGRHRLL